VLGLALAMALVIIVAPIDHSMSFAGGVLTILGLIGWALEARAVAGPPPEVEPEHEEEEEAPGPSYWPVILAIGIVCIAAGLIYVFEYGALVVALPLAAGGAAGWANSIKREMTAGAAAEAADPGPALIGPGGASMFPVQNRALVAQAAGGAAIAIEHVPSRAVTRRGLLRITFWTGLGAGLAAIGGSIVDMLYPRGVTGFGGVVSPGTVDQYPAGTKTQYSVGHFWLVHLAPEQGGDGFLALWWKCPHLGCTVPWRADFTFADPTTNQDKKGWFRCPCHGSTYNDAGVRVFGPAPRSMDVMDLTIDASGKISVNTGKVSKGTPDNAKLAVKG
jgi:cytochrome b6-f complex iron-sulfur subunit